MTSNVIPSTPLARPTPVEKHTPPILLSYSPKGSQQWIRKVKEEFTPRIGMEFDTLEDGVQFYSIYAIACGFDARKSSQRRLLVFKSGKYVICEFREGHNHPLVLVKNREFQKLSRNLTLYHKQTIKNHSKINIGASKTNRISRKWQTDMKTVLLFSALSSYSSPPSPLTSLFSPNHPSLLTFSDGLHRVSSELPRRRCEFYFRLLFHRRHLRPSLPLRCYVLGAALLCSTVDLGASLLDFKNFQREVKLFIGDADAEMFINNLEKLVQSKKDAHGKSAYLAFGDDVSFDPTYGTNKYCMVFTPFTGIDNHKKSSFVWVFQKFMEAMGRKEPQLVITDQDPAIRNAVPAVFKTARHQFCMWHIMNKFADKIDIITRKETDFLSRINGVAWNHDLEPTEFEDQWNEVITDFGLETNRWLSTMFDIKKYWIPAYTTQRSEKSNNSVSKAITPLSLESHALTVYTHEVFYEIQEEIKSSMCGCGIVGYSRSASLKMTAIEDSERGKTFTVQYSPLTSDVDCTCKLFERRGLICRHIFWIFSNKMLKTILEKYVLARWSKNALRGPIYDLNENIIENYDTADESQLEMSKVWSEFYNVISVVAKKEADVLRDLQRVLREFKDRVEPTNEKMSKRQEMKMLIGCSAPDEVRILPPRHSKNKGSGKRIKIIYDNNTIISINNIAVHGETSKT
ncbi:hypothetical protein RND81_07G057600 [Saponaria officinalis]|uniref:SWIM-type domain-containing protein n=1 Tax=Saponaria officinalis TaxID=3572 RepID=A0AAW1JKQ2_SAPOF